MKRFRKKLIILSLPAAAVGLWALAGGMLLNPAAQTESRVAYQGAGHACSDTIIYQNDKYGFTVTLPEDWKGYLVVEDEWQGYEVQTGDMAETGPFISIRNPKWTKAEPYQDIPIYVFTAAQWDELQKEFFHIGAAPMGPSMLARNEKFVFALPARYNYAFPKGWEEVDEILKNGAVRVLE